MIESIYTLIQIYVQSILKRLLIKLDVILKEYSQNLIHALEP
jgi:hypothetical protein